MKHINLSPDRLRSLDPQGMLGMTLELPEQIRRGIALGREFLGRHNLENVAELEWAGLGGSAVAGDLLQALGYEPPEVPLRLHVCRYPKPAAAKRLVASYSGNTVEALRAFEEIPPSQIWMTLSSGGRLADLAKAAGVPHLTVPAGYPPRAAVGFGLGAMLSIFDALYGTRNCSDFEAALPALQQDAQSYALLDRAANPALELASILVDRTPVIYTVEGRRMLALSLRLRAQLAENSKVWSHAAHLPELAHNEVETLPFLGQLLPPPLVVFLGPWELGQHFPDPRPGLRELLDEYRIQHITLDPAELWQSSTSVVEILLRFMLRLDAATVLLGVLRAEDPLVIPTITRLKKSTLPG